MAQECNLSFQHMYGLPSFLLVYPADLRGLLAFTGPMLTDIEFLRLCAWIRCMIQYNTCHSYNTLLFVFLQHIFIQLKPIEANSTVLDRVDIKQIKHYFSLGGAHRLERKGSM